MENKYDDYDTYLVAKPVKDIKNVFSSLFDGMTWAEMLLAGICFFIAVAGGVGLGIGLAFNIIAQILTLIVWAVIWLIFTIYLISNDSKTNTKHWQKWIYRFRFINKDNKHLSKVFIADKLGIKEINRGVAKTSGGKLIKFYKLSGLNIDLLSARDSNSLVHTVSRCWLDNDMTCKFIIVDEPFDVEIHNDYLQDLINKSNDKTCKDQLMIYGQQNETTYDQDIINKGVYIAIVGDNETQIHSNYISNIAPLESANIHIKEVNDNKTIISIFNMLFTTPKNSYFREDGKFNNSNLQDIKFTKTMSFNGQAYSTIYEISQLPNFVVAGWMKDLAQFSNVQVVASLYGANTNLVVQNLSRAKRKLKNNWSYIRNEGEQVTSSEYFENYDELIANLASSRNQPWYLNIKLILQAYEKKDLIQLQKDVFKALKNDKYKVNPLDYRQAQALSNIFNFNKQKSSKFDSLAIATDEVIGASFPFNSNALNDPKGLYLGNDAYAGTPFFLDFKYKDNDKRNSNVFTICGHVGGGKSYCAKHIINWLKNTGCKQFIIAPTEDYDNFAKHYDKVKFINVVDKKRGLINPLQIFSNNLTIQMHISQFIGWMNLLCTSDFDETETRLMTEILTDLYKHYKITDGQDFIKIANNKWPTGDDLYNFACKQLKKQKDSKAKIIIDRFWLLSKDGTYGHLWNGHTTIDVANDDMIIFQTKDISADNPKAKILMNGTMYLLFNFINSELQKNLDHNLKIKDISKYTWISVVVDEAHRLINKRNPIALNALIAMAKEIRHYQGILINVTQSISDFKKGGGDDIIKQSLYHIIFNLSGADITDYDEMLKDVGGLTQKGKEFVATAPRGDALILMGNYYRGFVSIKANEQNSLMWEDTKTGYSQ